MKKKPLLLLVLMALGGLLSSAQADVILGTAGSFAVLGATTVTSTGSTIVNGDLGLYPGLSITGFPPGGVTNGTIYAGGALAQQAQADAVTAYALLAGELPTANLSGQDLGGLTLFAGVRKFDATAQLTGILTLDALGDSQARFDFLIGSTLMSAAGASVVLLNGAQAGNVYWQVGSSATLGVGTFFAGSILADQSITLNSGANLNGRVLALNAAVTLDGNSISVPSLIPEPTTFLLLAFCATGFGAWRRLTKSRGVGA